MSVERLLSTLLYEGYALYPYTPGATKNATPTPFGIVYPPVYAAGSPHTFDRARMQLVLEPGETVTGTLAFLEESGERRVELEADATVEFAFDAVQGPRPPRHDAARGRARAGGDVRAQHDRGPRGAGSRGRAAVVAALHAPRRPRARAGASPRRSPPAPPPPRRSPRATTSTSSRSSRRRTTTRCSGATIVLPDHPQIAPESHGDLFDATEIEEALLLHVLALSDGERAAIAEQDPKVREMLARAEAEGPEALKRPARARDGVRPAARPPAGPGRRGRRAGHRGRRRDLHARREGAAAPGPGAAPQDGVWAGRIATIERIYRDYEDGVHLAVTVDDDPGQELMRDIGRYLYFKPAEVEVVV